MMSSMYALPGQQIALIMAVAQVIIINNIKYKLTIFR